jgi:hypothetical protein
MTYAVFLCFDSAGPSPLIRGEDSEPLIAGDGVRFRFVAETEDHGEAVRVAKTLRRRIAAGELRALEP